MCRGDNVGTVHLKYSNYSLAKKLVLYIDLRKKNSQQSPRRGTCCDTRVISNRFEVSDSNRFDVLPKIQGDIIGKKWTNFVSMIRSNRFDPVTSGLPMIPRKCVARFSEGKLHEETRLWTPCIHPLFDFVWWTLLYGFPDYHRALVRRVPPLLYFFLGHLGTLPS